MALDLGQDDIALKAIGEHQRAAARDRRADMAAKPRDVKQRRRRQHAVLAVQPCRAAIESGACAQIGVRQYHALGLARRPRGIDDQQRPSGVPVRGAGGFAVACQRDGVEQHRAVRDGVFARKQRRVLPLAVGRPHDDAAVGGEGGGVGDGLKFGMADEQRRRAIRDQPVQLAFPVHRIDRHGDHARLGRPQQGDDEAGDILQADEHPVAFRQPLAGEIGGEGVALLIERAIAGRAVEIMQRRTGGRRAHRRVEQRREIARRRHQDPSGA